MIIDKYKVVFKTNFNISLDYVFPKYTESYIELIFDNHIIMVKKRDSYDWWLVTSEGLVKAAHFLLSYDSQGFDVVNNVYDYGIAYVNYDHKNQDLESVIYFIGMNFISQIIKIIKFIY